ncbi:MAG: flagellin [Selenomonadaceae bacterium]
MSMVIRNNISALRILNIMNQHSSALTKSMQRLSSGRRINSAADDPSGYAISQRMQVQIRSLDQAARNAQNGMSLLKVSEGAVSSTVDILKTLKEKVLNAANDTNSDADRRIIQKELDQAIDQINDNANVSFNGKPLMDGSLNKQIGTATTSVFTNQKLGMATIAGSALTSLADRNGNTLDIKSTDTIKISFVQNGKTFTTSYAVGNTTLADVFSNATSSAGTAGYGFSATQQAGSFIGVDATGVSTYTADGTSAFSVAAASSGVTGQISGFTISVSGKDGNIKKSINEKLDGFSESIRAQNKSGDNALSLQIGTKSNQSITTALTDMRAQALGLQGTDPVTGLTKNIDVTTREGANAAISVFDSAIAKALDEQTNIGAVESRLDYTVSNLTTASENLTAAESTIGDVNMAKEIMEYTKHNILMQAAQAMLAQANQSSLSILSLLK